MNKWLVAITFSVLLLVPAGAQDAFAGATRQTCVGSSNLGALLVNRINCIQVDDKTFINFRNFVGNFDPFDIDVTGVTVGNEKGLQFNSVELSVDIPLPDINIFFDYDVISSGDPISDNTLTLDSFSILDDAQFPSTGVLIEERVFDAQQNQIAFKVVFADGSGALDLLDHVDYPSLHQMVTVNVHIGLTADISPGCVLSVCETILNQFTQTFSQQPQPESQVIGGEIIPIEQTSLLLASTQSFSWMIPVVLSVLGIGLFVVSRKTENS